MMNRLWTKPFAISMELANQIDWDAAAAAFSQAIAVGEHRLRLHATLRLANLAGAASESALSAAIPPLAHLLSLPDSPTPLHAAAALALRRIAARSSGSLCPAIAHSGAVLSLLQLIPTSEPPFRVSLLRCLAALVVFDEMPRTVLARNGGLEAVLELLTFPPDDSRRYLVEILSALALLRGVRRSIVDLGGVRYLVEAVISGEMTTRTRAAHAIGLLGFAKRARHILVESGAVAALIGLLKDGDALARLVAGNALGVVSSHVSHLRLVVEAGAIPLYAELLQGSDVIGREIAEDVFSVLAVGQENAVLILEHLVRILKGNNEEAKAAALDVLWDLAGYKNSGSVIRISGAISALFETLTNGTGDVREKAAGVIAQLSCDEANRISMTEVGIVPVLVELLSSGWEELKEFVVEALMNYADDPIFRGWEAEVFDNPSFQAIRDRLMRIRASEEDLERSMRMLNIEQFM